LKINQDAFDVSIRNGFAVLQNLNLKAAGLAAILAILCLFGILQRIREYR
jgi:hypothetical protein